MRIGLLRPAKTAQQEQSFAFVRYRRIQDHSVIARRFK